jgi:hypothetical protein
MNLSKGKLIVKAIAMGRIVWLVICVISVSSCNAFHRFFKSSKSDNEFMANKQEIIEKPSTISMDSNFVNMYVYSSITGEPYEYAQVVLQGKKTGAVFNLIMDESGKGNLRLPVGFYYVSIKTSSKSHYDSVILLGSTETTIRVGLGGEFIR